ncbi:MAG: hypothetical protein WC350_05005 [Candidatus Micrarchaeia archaeon]|jgi:hypothetical protein
MVEQLVTVGLGFIVLAWIIQAYSAFVSKKGKPNGFHIGFISLYALGALILGFDAYLSNSVFPAAANMLSALFAAAAYFVAKSK